MDKEMLKNLREEYGNHSPDNTFIPANPFPLFEKWLNEAVSSGLPEPNAMILSTVSERGTPSSRVVLLKGIDQNSLVFYTNYRSRKSRELDKNSSVSVIFNWLQLERQLRIEGEGIKLSAEESDAYFASRPRQSQLGAWASPQSEIVSSRKELDNLYLQMENRFKSRRIPRPEWWGGYRIIAKYFEFWMGKPGRMHDRFSYLKNRDNKTWKINRLAP